MKETKESVAIVIKNSNGSFLAVQRADDDSFGNMWGLPAASVRRGEELEDTAKRAAKDKLGVDIDILETIGSMTLDKGDCFEHLTEYLVDIVSGEILLETRDPSVSRYKEFKYSNEPSILIPAAQSGSICSRIFLKSNHLSWD